MAINNNLFISAPILQNYFVDKDTGLPLSAGVVTFYADNQRQTLKNVYYQNGLSPPYSYVPLPNPLILSSVGTIQDANGNDVIPYFYPFDENDETISQTYFVTCYNSDSIEQWTRSNFPFVSLTNEPLPANFLTLNNLLVNNVFWRSNLTTSIMDVSSLTEFVVAPGIHDGLNIGATISNQNVGTSDIRFIKNIANCVDSISLVSLKNVSFSNDVTPEYGINYRCTSPGTGELYKCIQIPICLHLNTLQNQLVTVTYWAQSNSGASSIQIGLRQFVGTGPISSPAFIFQPIDPISTSWSLQTRSFFIPPAVNTNIAGDDVLFLEICFPLNQVCNVSIAKPCLYIGSVSPLNEYTSYDDVNSVVSSNRTGDVRVSLNSFSPYGWVPMNDGTIGNFGSNSTTRANQDTWQLYNMIWNLFVETQNLAPMFTNSNVPTSYGVSAYNDFTAGNQISLTKSLGCVISNFGQPSFNQTQNPNSYSIGQYFGEQNHTLVVNELASHSHALNTGYASNSTSENFYFFPSRSWDYNSTPGLMPTTEGSGLDQGNFINNTPQTTVGHNTMQPTTFLNFFMKL